MNPSSSSIASRVRGLRARRLGQEQYLRELIELADLEDRSSMVNEVDRIAVLRGRIATLERKVEELEGHK